MNEDTIIQKMIEFVKTTLENAKPSHDFFHIERVYNMAVHIAEEEKVDNMLVVKLWALLHDIADYKYHDGDETIWPKIAWEFLSSLWIDDDIIVHVQNIIKNISYSTNLWEVTFQSKELDIVKDADKLDALWAIWIARCLCFSGEKGREIYNPKIEVKLNMSKEEYKKHKSTAINHFYEKLLTLKDLIITDTGKKIAQERHTFMEKYLEQFMKEINF